MFDNLSDRLNRVLKKISGKGRITEDNIKSTLREVRMALLEADVALPVVKDFVTKIKYRALGKEVKSSLSPGQAFLKIVKDEMIVAMGQANEKLDLKSTPPAIILMAGLQGAGKTTTAAKLAKYLIEREKKSVMVVSADVYRPAAIDQLEKVANEVGAQFHPSKTTDKPEKIVKSAIEQAKKSFSDVLIIDTAGRLAIDDEMMAEIKLVHATAKPIETLFVVDSMTGQDAANTARAFDEALPLTGVILTKADGDARGGAALSIRHITQKPIKFIGIGEKLDALEPFHPERIASRILGMGDVLSLIEEVERNVDREKAEKLANKVVKGQTFDLEDFKEQLQQMKNMGGLSNLVDKLPGMANVSQAAKDQLMNDKPTRQMEAIICSMTPKEKAFPEVINGSRKRRIAEGSGTDVQAVNRLLKQFKQMQKMMKKMKGKGGMMKMMRGLQNMMPPGGGMPPFKH
ncbi:MAG: signal recognition particle protein [Gammaproteobacteria bacterium]|nr:signal recognition particle protein [Gammaproteobacteria bacterium]